MCGELDGLGFLLDAPYVATPHHGLDAPHHRLDAPHGCRRSSLGSFGFHSVVSLGPPPSDYVAEPTTAATLPPPVEEPAHETPYEARKPQPRGPAGGDRPARERARPARYNFVVELKDLIAVPNIAERLRRPAKTDKVLGPRKDSWCEFHEAFGHQIDNCLSLG